MDLDTLIYIIVMVLFIALGAFGKKKKPVPQSFEEEESGDDGLLSDEEKISQKLKSFLGEFEKKEKVPAEDKSEFIEQDKTYFSKDTKPDPQKIDIYEDNRVKSEVVEPSVMPLSYEQTSDETPEFQHFEIAKDQTMMEGDLTNLENQPFLPGEYNLLFEEFPEGIDLRKAILHSEIINRRIF